MMGKRSTPTIGDEFADQLTDAMHQFQQTPNSGSRGLPVITGLLANKSQYSLDPDTVILAAIVLLIASGKVYTFGADIVYETDSFDGSGLTLLRLRTGLKVESGAENLLANLFNCTSGDEVFPPPSWFVKQLLRSDLLKDRLPRIVSYARRPMFDENFNLCSPGWHPESGILIHGPHIEPVKYTPADPSLPVLERLPHHIRTLFSGFCFKTAADVANALSMLLTGFLANHFVKDPKGLFLIDGSQPGVGKTLLVRCLGMILDGFDPRILTYLSNDEELEKRICSQLRGKTQSLIFIDNAKTEGVGVISSRVLEANCVAPEVSIRILGSSDNQTRPNDMLWAVTMNSTRLSPDLVSRGAPILLAYEGRVEDRTFTLPQPLEYARDHRLQIFGELAGMIIHWKQVGLPDGERSHRSAVWARKLGGILLLAGFPEFLANNQEAAAAFNSELEVLAALAETVVLHSGPFLQHPNTEG